MDKMDALLREYFLGPRLAAICPFQKWMKRVVVGEFQSASLGLYLAPAGHTDDLAQRASLKQGGQPEPCKLLRRITGEAGKCLVGFADAAVFDHGVTDQGIIDYDAMRQVAKAEKPKIVLAGFSQGGAIGNIRQLLYGWNEAVLRQRGPCPEALVPGPVYRGMRDGHIVRFEEIARCSTEVQDGILSILSERQILVPELDGERRVLFARAGFNIVATSNTLDQGVREMSAALKRRMNFETIEPIPEVGDEVEVVIREASRALLGSGVSVTVAPDIVEVLVTIFHELRNGQTVDGRSTDRLAAAVMSTAEAVSVVHAMGIHAYYYRDGTMHAEDLVHFLVGASLKDNREDRRRLRHYFDTEVALRKASVWQVVYAHRELL